MPPRAANRSAWMNRGDVVEDRWDQRRQHHVAVADLQELRHHEGGRAHHRRHQLPAGRGHRLDGGRRVGGVAALAHQRDGDHSGRDDVGHRAARDRAEQRRSGHRDLGRAAAVAAHQRGRDIGEEPRSARGVEEHAEIDERDHDGRRHGERNAQQPVRVESEIDEHPVDIDRTALEGARNEMAHQPEGDEQDHEPEQHSAGGPPEPLGH